MGIIRGKGRTYLTGEAAKRFLHNVFHPNEEAKERFNTFLKEDKYQVAQIKDGLEMRIEGNDDMDMKEILFRRVYLTDKDFIESVGPDGREGKHTADLGVRLNTLFNLIEEMGLWDEYIEWVGRNK